MAHSEFVAGKELFELLARHSTPVRCSSRRVLFSQGDESVGIYILSKGNASLTMQSAAGGVILRLKAGPGSLLGLPGVIANRPYSLTAVAHRGAQVGFVARDDFAAIMPVQSMFALKVLQMLADKVHAARSAIGEP